MTFTNWWWANARRREDWDTKECAEAAWEAATAAERERLGRPPAGQYRCGCPLVVCDNIKAFCPAHHKTILPVGEPT
jgi:hypothetical protein